MRLSNLKPPKGARRAKKLRGRGSGSGHGKTSCRGHKGQRARSGSGRRPGFEGGQMPLIRRIPKRGFTSKFKKIYQIVNLRDFNVFKPGSVVTLNDLKTKGLIKSVDFPVKILGDGQLNAPLTIQGTRFSKSSLKKIKDVGGKAELVK